MAYSKPTIWQPSLALEAESGTPVSALYASYQWTDVGLREEVADGAVLYGYWDHVFGCWIAENNDKPQELVPDWPFLAASIPDPEASRLSVLNHRAPGDGRPLRPGPRADVFFAEYINTIPTICQRLAAPFGAAQWMVLDLIHQKTGFWRFLLREQVHGRLGWIRLILTLFQKGDLPDRADRQALAARLMASKRPDLMLDHLGGPLDAALLRRMSTLPASMTKDDMEWLLDVIEDMDPASAIERINQRSLELETAAISVPERFCRSTIAKLLQQGVPATRINYLVKEATRLLSETQKRAAIQTFSEIRAPQSLQWWVARWTDMEHRNRPFPRPPAAARAPLFPIVDYQGLKAEAHAMQNGLTTFLPDVLAGDLAFYHWDGQEPATVCLAATPAGDWIFHEALGVGNRPLRSDTIAHIRDHFAN